MMRRASTGPRARHPGVALGALLGALGTAALLPSPAAAHGIGGASSPGIPGWLFAWAAAAALVASFAALAAFWRTPQLEHATQRRLFAVPQWLDPACGAFSVVVFAGLVYAGLAGAQDSLDNILPTWVFVVFWVAVPVSSALLGDVFRPFNPWRAIGRGVAWGVRRSGLSVPEPMAYPDRLGHWPAVLTVLVFGWIELAFSGRDDPSTLAVLALAYAVGQLVAMSIYGVEAWEQRGDGFAVYFGLFARLAPLTWRDGWAWWRRPLAGTTALAPLPGTVALICTGLGITMFDGLSSGPLWLDVVPTLQSGGERLGLSTGDALELASTIGLLACALTIAGAYRIGIAGMRNSPSDPSTGVLSARYVHSLIPIALAYIVAHYASLLIFQGQAVPALVSDPLGNGANWFGTATVSIDYGLIGSTTLWLVQVSAVVAGHVAGLSLAHDRALVSSRGPKQAARSQRSMLVIMVGLTSLALWLISSANQ